MILFLMAIVSLIVLVKSADIFVEQASSLAKRLKVNDFLIGFTVVAFGTSLPELISTIFSALEGHNQLVMSNIIGSNIANLCLIFGLIAVFNSYTIYKRDVNLNIPLNAMAMMVFWGFAVWSGFVLSWPFGISLILIFIALILLSKDYNHLPSSSKKEFKPFKLWVLTASLILLIGSGKVCIDSIISLAKQLNIAESVLGYFLLAVGTSLPELVTTWAAVKKKDDELGMGNILGSNLFNLLFILGTASFIGPIDLSNYKIELIILTMTILAVYLFAVFGKKYSFSRKEGLGLLSIYISFAVFQILRVRQ